MESCIAKQDDTISAEDTLKTQTWQYLAFSRWEKEKVDLDKQANP